MIELFSGDRLVLRHPEAVVSAGDLIVFVNSKPRLQLFESQSVCQLLGARVTGRS